MPNDVLYDLTAMRASLAAQHASKAFEQLAHEFDTATSEPFNPSPRSTLEKLDGVFVFMPDAGPSFGPGKATRVEVSTGDVICISSLALLPRDGRLAMATMIDTYDARSLVKTAELVMGPFPGLPDKWFTYLMQAVAVDSPTSAAPPFHTGQRLMGFSYTNSPEIPAQYYTADEACDARSSDGDALIVDCKSKERSVATNGKEDVKVRTGRTLWTYAPAFKSRLPKTPPADTLDYRIGNAPWHSQAVSAALAADRKAAANALFAQGFDLYKTGDFEGSETLIKKGLETDPANYLAWFTLGEIHRAAFRAGQAGTAARDAVFAFQRVIDLAPQDSAQATLAKGYLDALR